MATMKIILVLIVLVTITIENIEARRTILKGRKALTRTYLRELAIPAWAIIVLIGLGQILFGAILYVIMKKVVLDPGLTGSYSPAPTNES